MKPLNEDGIDAASGALPVPLSIYRLDLAYCGANYHGFQSQPSGRGIQDTLEKALATFCRHPIRVTSSSRTDTGVHAEQQVVTFKSSSGLEVYRMVKALNALLPVDIRVRNAQVVTESFHPSFNSTGKAYKYRIWTSAGESPFITPYVWQLTQELNVSAMQEAANYLVGTHDFTSFCAVDSSAKSKVRRVTEIVIVDRRPLIEIWVVGDGFLKQMVRNFVGAFVAVGRGKISASQVKTILEGRERKLAPATAPASGLCLAKVFYNDNLKVDPLLQDASNGYNVSLSGSWI